MKCGCCDAGAGGPGCVTSHIIGHCAPPQSLWPGPGLATFAMCVSAREQFVGWMIQWNVWQEQHDYIRTDRTLSPQVMTNL